MLILGAVTPVVLSSEFVAVVNIDFEVVTELDIKF